MPVDEELQVLCTGSKEGSRGRVIVAGALHFLKQWPGPSHPDLLGAILAGCLLSVAFIVLALVPVIIAIGPHTQGGCHQHRRPALGSTTPRTTNLYFLKHENRSWTNEEFCSVETAARRYPHYNIFIINLLKKEGLERNNELVGKYFDEMLEECISSKDKIFQNLKNPNSLESELRYALAEIPNVRNIDIGVDRFFARSMMSKIIKSFSIEKIELAAKFQVIWDSSGIALEPLNVHQLEAVGRFMNKNKIDMAATVQIDNDLQAASVPCQSFYGFVISRIAETSFTDRQSLLKHALMDYCPSPMECPGVRIAKPVSEDLLGGLTCPIVFPFISMIQESRDDNVIKTNK